MINKYVLFKENIKMYNGFDIDSKISQINKGSQINK